MAPAPLGTFYSIFAGQPTRASEAGSLATALAEGWTFFNPMDLAGGPALPISLLTSPWRGLRHIEPREETTAHLPTLALEP